ncbi:MAG: stage II sporulation protein D [Clostridia bacterium]|nr:stage II sporulation protein D [Clostridia bacterium]
MKSESLYIFNCILIIILIPIILFLCHNRIQKKQDKNEITILVLDKGSKNIISMPFEEYVWRATAKEVPSSFEDDAIMAQAVAVRTYAYRKLGKKISEHNGADVCTDFNHCTAFLLPGDEEKTYGENAKQLCKRYRTLSKKTQNQILTYNNEPILAAFHAISSGRTEKSSDVWSEQLPYLINVDSELDKNVNGYLSTVSLKQTELKNYFSDNADTNISIISRTDGGNVKEINIFGNIYTGQDVRNKLNLRSANFSVKKNKDEYIFEVYGYGHGVGMSQCGANEYAKKGMDYQKILLKYFPNTVLSTIN